MYITTTIDLFDNDNIDDNTIISMIFNILIFLPKVSKRSLRGFLSS